MRAACVCSGAFELEVVTAIKPQDNSLLEGLYKSSGNFCTQVRAPRFGGRLQAVHAHFLRHFPRRIACVKCLGVADSSNCQPAAHAASRAFAATPAPLTPRARLPRARVTAAPPDGTTQNQRNNNTKNNT